MSEVVVNEPLAEASAPSSASVLPKLFQIAWRNVWRNKRRTLLTVGGIIFAVWLLVFMRSFQVGVFSQMADMTARAMPGHAQIQDPRYEDEPLMEHTIDASLAIYGTLPSYRAMLDKEGLNGPGDLALVGDEGEVRTQLDRLRAIGVTDFTAAIAATNPEDGLRTREFLASEC